MAGNNIFLRNLHLLNDTLKLSSSKRSCRILKEVKRHVASSHIFQTVYSFCFFLLYFFHCLSRNIVPSVSGSLRSRRSSTGSNFLGCKLNTEQKKTSKFLSKHSLIKSTHMQQIIHVFIQTLISLTLLTTHTRTHTQDTSQLCALSFVLTHFFSDGK